MEAIKIGAPPGESKALFPDETIKKTQFKTEVRR